MTYIVKSTFHQKYTAKHPKGCRVPIDVQPGVTDEFDRLQKVGPIEKLTSCSEVYFISIIVITV